LCIDIRTMRVLFSWDKYANFFKSMWHLSVLRVSVTSIWNVYQCDHYENCVSMWHLCTLFTDVKSRRIVIRSDNYAKCVPILQICESWIDFKQRKFCIGVKPMWNVYHCDIYTNCVWMLKQCVFLILLQLP